MQTKTSTPFNLKRGFFSSFIPLLLLIFQVQVQAQTPGLIFQPAGNAAGRSVLDPNGDNYVSKTSTGYAATYPVGAEPTDIGAAVNEIPYRLLPQLGTTSPKEPQVDLSTGSGGGHTDLAANPLYMAFNGQQVLFRVRLGGNSTASKGYSFLIDSDGVFNKQALANGSLVDYSTPSKVKNLGFEFEVVLALNFDVVVYRHRGSGSDGDPFTSNVIWRASNNGGYNQYFQKAIAASLAGGDTDYFFDFYVPLSAFSGDGGRGIDPSTPLRVTGSSVTSAQTGLEGTISDIGGVDDRLYGNDKYRIWRDLIPAFPPTSLNQIQSGEFCQSTAPVAPVLNNVTAGAGSVTGTSSENGGTITLFRNGSQIVTASPVTVANSSFTFPISGTTLAAGDILTVRVTRAASGSCAALTSVSSNTVTVGQAVTRCATPAPTIASFNSNQQSANITSTVLLSDFTYNTTTQVPGALKVYRDGIYYPGSYTLSSQSVVNNVTVYNYIYTPTTCTSANYRFSFNCGSNNNGNNYGTLTATVTANGCESPRSSSIYLEGNTVRTTPSTLTTTTAPTINNAFYCVGTTTPLTGTVAANAPVYLSINSQPVTTDGSGNLTPTTTADASGVYSINLSLYQLVAGDVISVRTKIAGRGLSAPTTITVGNNCVTTAPTITSLTPCPTVSTITGTSTEAAGTLVTVYRRNGSAPNTATDTRITDAATVQANGTFSAPVLPGVNLVGGNVLYAVAIAPGGKTVSAASATTTVTTPATAASLGLTLSSPIKERATLITGTSTTNGTVNIFIDGQRIAGTALITGASATNPVTYSIAISSTNQQLLAAGTPVTASITPAAGGCESQQTAPVAVSCSAPSTSPTIATTSLQVCEGSRASITVNNTENGVIYQVYQGNDPSGPAMVGNGGTIIIQSGILTQATQLRVRAFNVNSPTCQSTITGSTAITIIQGPVAVDIQPTASTLCNGERTRVYVNNSEIGTTYQLQVLNPATGLYVNTGESVLGGGGSQLSLISDPITSSGTFKVIGIRNGCPKDMGIPFTITVPSNTLAITPSDQSICTGNTASVVLQGSETGITYQLQRNNGTGFVNTGTAVTGTGGNITLTSATINTAGKNEFRILASKVGCSSFPLTQMFTVNVTSTINSGYEVSPATQAICSGLSTTLNLSGSQLGVTYQIINPNGQPIGEAVTGTGNAITLATGTLTVGGTYSVRATTACGSMVLANTANITVNPTPVAYSISPVTQAICNGNTATVTVAGSQLGVVYQVQRFNGTAFVNTGVSVTGTGSSINLVTGALLESTNLQVIATIPGGCSVPMANRAFVYVPSSNLVVAAVTPTVCSGGIAQIRVNNSQTGVTYQLFVGGSPSGMVVEGTGGDIVLTSNAISSTTDFTVRGVTTSPTACDFQVGSQVRVNVATPINQTSFLTTPSSICSGGVATIRLVNSEAGVTYQIYNGNTPTGFGVAGTGGELFLTTDALNSTANLQVRAIRTGCSTVNIGSAYTVNVTSRPERLSFTSTNQVVCEGGTISITLPNSQSGVAYRIYNGSTPTGNAVTGNGGSITLTSDAISSSATFTVQALGSGSCENVTLEGFVGVTVPIITANAGVNTEVCATSVMLNAAPAPAGTVGMWTLLAKPAGAGTVSFVNPNDPRTTVTGLNAGGAYFFRWTVTSTTSNCGSRFSDVVVTKDCDPIMVLNAPTKPADRLANDETLFIFDDPDAAFLLGDGVVFEEGPVPGVSFEVMPDGTLRFFVSDRKLIQEGTFLRTLRTRDAAGGFAFISIPFNFGEPLPVVLTRFTATPSTKGILLEWATASEENNAFFQVERSQDARNFVSIGKVEGNGTTTVAQNYSLTDFSAPAGTVYYRLKQVDIDGQFEYSRIVQVRASGVTVAQVAVAPNPFIQKLSFSVFSEEDRTVLVELYDLKQQLILREQVELKAGKADIEKDLSAVANGVYILRVSDASFNEVIRVVKTN